MIAWSLRFKPNSGFGKDQLAGCGQSSAATEGIHRTSASEELAGPKVKQNFGLAPALYPEEQRDFDAHQDEERTEARERTRNAGRTEARRQYDDHRQDGYRDDNKQHGLCEVRWRNIPRRKLRARQAGHVSTVAAGVIRTSGNPATAYVANLPLVDVATAATRQ